MTRWRPAVLAAATATATGLLGTHPGSARAQDAPPAPTLATERSCYLLGEDETSVLVRYTGTGFPARTPWRTFAGREELSDGQTDATGAFEGRLTASLDRDAGEVRFAFTAEAGDATDTARFALARTTATFSPLRGDPRTLRVRFRVFGMGARRSVYLHWVSPSGRHRDTVRLGRTGSGCGRLVTSRRRLFPFRPRAGRWRLQVDGSRTYSRRTPQRALMRVRVTRLGR